MSLGAARASNTRQYQLLDTGIITSTGSQSYTIPAGTLYIEIEMWGGGAGGGCGDKSGGRGGTTHQAGGGGGGGAYVKHIYQVGDMQPSDTLNFTVGAGGAGATTPGGINGRGDDGGATTLDTHKRSTTTITSFNQSAGGGIGGRSQASITNSPPDFSAGGTATNGSETNTDGQDGGTMQSPSGTAQDGQGGGKGAEGGAGGAGGDADEDLMNYGQDGTAPGGGGGGGASDCTASVCEGSGSDHDGGAGADGKVIVKVYG
jgi:hypothetical protein